MKYFLALTLLLSCERTSVRVDGRCSVSIDTVEDNVTVHNDSRAPFTPLFLPMPVPYPVTAEAAEAPAHE